MLQILPDTKESLLRVVSQEAIIEKILGLKVEPGTRITSPVRQDSHPSCEWFYTQAGKLMLIDHAAGKRYDCFDLVGMRMGLGYNQTIRYLGEVLQDGFNPAAAASLQIRSTAKSHFQTEIAPLSPDDLRWLDKFGILPTTAQRFRIHSVRYLRVNGREVYGWRRHDPAVGTFFGFDSAGNEKWKIHFYGRGKDQVRFMGNTNRIIGYVQLPAKGPVLILSKSVKDVALLSQYGLPAIAMQGEGVLPYPYIIESLKRRFDLIVSWYDFDATGIRSANKLRKLAGIQPILLTNGRFGSVDYKAKDITDHYAIHGKEKTSQLIASIKTHLGLQSPSS